MRSGNLLVVALFALVACTFTSPEAMGEEKAKAKTFTLDTQTAETAAGAEGKLTVSITPAKGYKWNKDFPALFRVTSSDAPVASFATTEFRGDAFKNADKKVSVAAPFKGTKAGTETIVGELRFSVCDAESCIIANEKVSATLTVK